MAYLIPLALIAAILVWAFYKVPWFNQLLKDSETIAIQVGKIVVGALGSVLYMVDPQMLQDATQAIVANIGLEKWWPVYALGLGIFMIAVRQFRRE